ncbi:MAG: 30S ribosomal protein S8 [Planctomycetota bacterium]|nr:MAG: 30S ribosomal protein S8 [Planctomycetota bacterium]
MTMTDPIADMLTRIRNGIQVRKKIVEMPASKIKSSVALALKDQGYLRDVEAAKDVQGFGLLRLHLKYDQDGRSAITELTRISKPGCRVYVGSKDIPQVRRGLGTALLSTPKGVMTGKQASEQGLGGEVLCTIF